MHNHYSRFKFQEFIYYTDYIRVSLSLVNYITIITSNFINLFHHLKTERDSTNNKTLSRARALLLCVDAHSWWAMHHQPAGAMTAGGWAYTGCW